MKHAAIVVLAASVGLAAPVLASDRGGAGAAPPSQLIRRIAVLSPRGPGDADNRDANPARDAAQPPRLTVGDLLATQARLLLAQKGFEVVDPTRVAAATNGRVPVSAQMAAQIAADAHLDATAMYIAVRVWQASYEGMRTDSILVALDVTLVDPRNGQVVWEAHRPLKPVPLHGTVLTGQADVFAAETVMREVLAPLAAERSAG